MPLVSLLGATAGILGRLRGPTQSRAPRRASTRALSIGGESNLSVPPVQVRILRAPRKLPATNPVLLDDDLAHASGEVKPRTLDSYRQAVEPKIRMGTLSSFGTRTGLGITCGVLQLALLSGLSSQDRGSQATRAGPRVVDPDFAGVGTLQIASHFELCAHLRSDDFIGNVTLVRDRLCSKHSTGNMLSNYFLCKGIASAAGLTLSTACHEEDTVQALLPQDVVQMEFDVSWEALCDSCKQRFPHKCKGGLGLLPFDFIRKQLRAAMHRWRVEHSDLGFDEAAIHVRCGDLLRYRHHIKYGFSPYHTYLKTISRDVKSIGIVTSSFSTKRCRNVDCREVGKCKAIIEDLEGFLRDTYAHVNVTIRNGPEETAASSYARLFFAKQSFCNPSTFCVYPTLFGDGEGFLVDTPLYPWVEKIAPQYNSTVLKTHFLNMRMIVDGRMDTADIIAYLSDWKGA